MLRPYGGSLSSIYRTYSINSYTPQINRNIIPSFYRYLQSQEPSKQAEFAAELRSEIAKLVSAADATGPFFLGSNISFVDIQVAPWILRMRRVLKHYRSWPDPEEGSRWRDGWMRLSETKG